MVPLLPSVIHHPEAMLLQLVQLELKGNVNEVFCEAWEDTRNDSEEQQIKTRKKRVLEG